MKRGGQSASPLEVPFQADDSSADGEVAEDRLGRDEPRRFLRVRAMETHSYMACLP